MTLLLTLHAAATLAMTGLIWFVQLVHYPLFTHAAAGDFKGFASEHQQRTTWVVAPLMLTEAATATAIVAGDAASWWAWTGMVLLVIIWLSTALVQVPLHSLLATGFDSQAAKRLVLSNWVRTLAWTARAGIALHLLALAG
ncbi:MAG: hypothetical protein AAF560_00415 [Acidobacteriota bacterium]